MEARGEPGDGICGEDVGREYVRLHFPESSKRRMEELVANLIDAYRVSITNSDWLGEDTKAKALEKILQVHAEDRLHQPLARLFGARVSADALPAENAKAANLYETGYQLAKVGQVGRQGRMADESADGERLLRAEHERHRVPGRDFAAPFFDPKAEDAANYGGIGAVIGHEIGHGFDDQGSQYDGDGKLNNWWTDEDRKNFEARTGASIAQYNSFVPLQLAEKYADEPDKHRT